MRASVVSVSLVIGLCAMTPCAVAAEKPAGPAQVGSNPSHLPKGVRIQLVRNATMRVTCGGVTFLTDPMFSRKGTLESFAGTARNPTVEMPLSENQILAGVEAVIVSHLHPDHFDKAAIAAIPKELPILCQPGDETAISGEGFTNVIPVGASTVFKGITITRVGGRHGRGEMLEFTGKVSGFVFQAAEQPTAYWAGDTIWCEEVETALRLYRPSVVVTHSGGAVIPGHEAIIMDAEQTLSAAGASPDSTLVAIHMESLDHCTVSRPGLRRTADAAGIAHSRLRIPENGEIMDF